MPDWMPGFLVAPLFAGFSLADFLGLFALLNFVLFFVMFEIWLERKVGGHIQLRRGPLHVGPHGTLQSPADVLKLLTKEDLMPTVADRRVFKIAPYMVFIPVFLTFLVIPWGPLFPFQNLVLRPFDLGLLYIVAIPALQSLGMVMAGWSSGNKYSLLGAARVVAQLISYELPMVVALLGVGMLAESLSLTEIVDVQRRTLWFAFLQPIGFLVFFAASMAEMSRTPFDIAIAESEIVGGPFIEYSGMRWGMFFLAEFAAVLLNSALVTALFLGGWQFLPGIDFLPELGALWFLGKTMTLIVLIQWARFTLPRLRVDQLMDLAWKVLLPAAFVNVILTAVFQVFGFLAFALGV
ncbi:MAG: NADH-quinone oxidoreductase subunit NuoH, partial [Chloroflexi bacterium]|nr:NADH-quinone oxidoreductase subunit NuoH [Chloroflexota bacterium]